MAEIRQIGLQALNSTNSLARFRLWDVDFDSEDNFVTQPGNRIPVWCLKQIVRLEFAYHHAKTEQISLT